MNKPPGRKPRNAAARFGSGTAYGDLTSAAVPEMADDWSIEPSASPKAIPSAVIGIMSASATGIEIHRYGVKRQQGTLGLGGAAADAGAWWWSSKIIIMAVLESAAGA